MKRFIALFLALMLSVALCACGGGSSDLGKYGCTSIVMNDVDLGAGDEWIELKADGKATVYMSGQTHEATYTLEEGAFSLTIGEQEVGTGTVTDGKMSMDFLGMTCVFELGVDPDAQAEAGEEEAAE